MATETARWGIVFFEKDGDASMPTMNKQQAARLLGKSTRSIRQYVADGRLTCSYVNGSNGQEARFDEAELRQFKTTVESFQLHRVEAPTIRMDGGYRKVQITIQADLHTAAQRLLIGTELEFSQLVQELVLSWTEKRGIKLRA